MLIQFVEMVRRATAFSNRKRVFDCHCDISFNFYSSFIVSNSLSASFPVCIRHISITPEAIPPAKIRKCEIRFHISIPPKNG